MTEPWTRTLRGWRHLGAPRLVFPRRGQRRSGRLLHYALAALALPRLLARAAFPRRPAAMREVLFVGRSHFGDFLMAVPALRLFRQSVPGCRMTAVLQGRYPESLRLEELLDATIGEPSPGAGFRARFGAWRQVFRAGRFDTVIFPRLTREDLPALLAAFVERVPRRVGGADKAVQALLTHVDYPPGPERLPRSQQRLVASFLDVPEEPLAWPSLAPPRAAPARPDLLLVPFAQHTKTWGEASWREFCREMRGRGYSLAAAGAAGDAAAGAALFDGCGVADLIGRTDLPELFSLVASSRCVVAVDTGVRHIAAMLGVPCVVLGNGREEPEVIGSYVPTERFLAHPVPCAPCGAEPCPLVHLRCVRGTGVAEVIAAVEELLGDRTAGTGQGG